MHKSRIAIIILRVLLFLEVTVSFAAFASNGAKLDRASSEPLLEEKLTALSQMPQWRKLLYYMNSWLLTEKSLVDDPNFFLSEKGKTDATSELAATVDAFTKGTNEERQNTLCKFPARRLWLEEQLQTTFAEPLPELNSDICLRYRTFKRNVQSNKASLIFSSHFPGNPGSLFGHTLIKFSRTAEAGAGKSDLLDYGLNHAAHPTTSNPLLYAVMGLTGFFPGYISFMPYYVKVQEYNNAESRDLWEYELSLNPKEIRLALLSVFELSAQRIDYFYFDDNCSLLMLAILDVARPSLNLVSQFNSWVIPGDTVRVLYNTPELVSRVKFRPSNVRRYLTREKVLNEEERGIFNTLAHQLKQNKVTTQSLNKLTPEQQVRVLDSLIEYIDAVEQVAGTKEPIKWKNERTELLNARAQIRMSSKEISIEPPIEEAPHVAYPPTRLTLGQIISSSTDSKNQLGTLLGWRPALHSLDNPIAGMGADLGITFFNLETIILDNKLLLREFTPLKIETLSVDQPHMSSKSWGFSIRYKQKCFAGCATLGVDGSRGKAWRFFSDRNRFALRATVEVGKKVSKGLYLEPGFEAQLNMSINNSIRWLAESSISRDYTAGLLSKFIYKAQTSLAVRPFSPLELSLSHAMRHSEDQNETQSVAKASWYF